jgi:adenylyltransferase/sulfurtransferase
MKLKNFKIEGAAEDLNPFDRQALIPWWDQDRLRAAKVLVIGAGAIGNEALKNLVLLGIGYILVVDFDIISASNLSRTILFRRDDIGKSKADVAAQRLRELCLEDTAAVDGLHCDVVWDLGTGVFREVDVILGCVDNIEARLAVNNQAWLAGRPWIDAGIRELAGHVAVYEASKPPCYLCGATQKQLSKHRERYSCDDFKRMAYSQHRVATVQISSAIAAALQVQEAVKLLCRKPSASGHKIIFQGTTNDFDTIQIKERADCPAHLNYPSVKRMLLNRSCTLRNFLAEVSEWGIEGASIDIGGAFSFVESVRCRGCGVYMKLNAPVFRIFDSDLLCAACKSGHIQPIQEVTERISRTRFSLESTPAELLDLTLAEIGIPLYAVVTVQGADGETHFFELGGDAAAVFPSIYT